MEPISSSVIFYGGEIFDGRDLAHPQVTLQDGTKAAVRVRIMPQRHLIPLLDLFDLSREAELIERCTQQRDDTGAWQPADAAFIDSLDDPSHVMLVDTATRLNFTRAVSAAERQIATGTGLIELKSRMSAMVLAPLKQELESWMSRLMQQVSSALDAKKS
jgi:hypothetical protein